MSPLEKKPQKGIKFSQPPYFRGEPLSCRTTPGSKIFLSHTPWNWAFQGIRLRASLGKTLLPKSWGLPKKNRGPPLKPSTKMCGKCFIPKKCPSVGLNYPNPHGGLPTPNFCPQPKFQQCDPKSLPSHTCENLENVVRYWPLGKSVISGTPKFTKTLELTLSHWNSWTKVPNHFWNPLPS